MGRHCDRSQGGAANFRVQPRNIGAGWSGKEPAISSARIAEVLRADFASVLLRDPHTGILEQAISDICSIVHTFADFLRIGLCVLRYQPENGGE